MLGLKYLIVITKREYSEQYLEFFRSHGVNGVVSTLCNGTATDSTLDMLGIEKTEKIMFKLILPLDKVKDVEEGLVSDMYIGEQGNGIAIFIPVDGVGGSMSLKYFLKDIPINKEDKMEVKDSKAVLIITIVDKGNTDACMDVARNAGASGGTVVKAKGTGAEIAKFFGISISEEKEMIYIVSPREKRDDIMKAIMEKVGGKTDAHGIVFSLPIDNVLGIRQLETR